MSPRAALICPRAIVIPTDMRNPWSAVDGMRVIYFVMRKAYTNKIIHHAMIANAGRRMIPALPCARTKVRSIDESAPATP